jgi:ribosomal protein S25
VTPAQLVEKMGLEPDNAQEILRLMQQKGMLQAEVKSMGRGQNMTYYHLIEPNPPAQR